MSAPESPRSAGSKEPNFTLSPDGGPASPPPVPPRSAPSSSISGVGPVPNPAQSADVFSTIARILILARQCLSGQFDVASSLNDMVSMEKCVIQLSTAFRELARSCVAVAVGATQVAAALPPIGEAAAKACRTFVGAFPGVGQFFGFSAAVAA